MDQAEVDALCLQLAKNSNGARAHTANKAAMYLRQFFRNRKGFEDGSFDRFVALVRGAVYRDEWDALRKRMERWW